MNDLWGRVSGGEIVWTVVACCGFVLNSLALVDAWRDLRALERSGITDDDARRLVADGNVWDEIIRVVVQVLFIFAGLVAMSIPANPYVTGLRERMLIPGAITIGVVLTVVKAAHARVVRHRVMALYREEGC